MGQGLLLWYREKCKPSWKVAFFSTFVIGLLVHMYKFTNTLLISDSFWNFYSNQDMTASGRWFLQYACAISSYFDLPWINGLLSVIYISLTMVVIVRLFKLENPVLICICSALLVTYPAVTSTFFYGYTADGYMLAMLLAAIGVYFIRFEEKRISRLILAGVCLCLCCGIYQAYVSFALVLTVFLFWQEMFEKSRETKEILKWLGSRVAVLVASMASYWIIWKLCLRIKNVEVSDYQGIDDVGKLSLSSILVSLRKIVETLAKVVFDWDPTEYGISLAAVLNIITLICFVAVVITAIVKSGLFRKKAQFGLLVLSAVALPFFICIWQLTSQELSYHMLMLQSVSLLFIYTAILFEKWAKIKWRSAVGIFLAVVVCFFAVEANKAYYSFALVYEKTHATATEIVARVHEEQTGKDVEKIAFVGYRNEKEFSEETRHMYKYSYVGQLRPVDNITSNSKAYDFINHYFQLELDPVSDEECDALFDSEEVQAMGEWPATDSVKVIGDTVVVKLSGVKPSAD